VSRETVRALFHRQWLHALGLTVLLSGLSVGAGLQSVGAGGLWGWGTLTWYWVAAGIAVAHQTYVWVCWRLELHTRGLSRLLGEYAFGFFGIGFAGLGLSRVTVVVVLAVANRGTLPVPEGVAQGLAVVALLPSLYLFYSVHRYFGFRRALGADHFVPDYRYLPLVREGIFRYTKNGMYVFGLLILWVPGLWFGSTAAVVIALFNHLYIWIHYHATEKPDMQYIYEGRSDVAGSVSRGRSHRPQREP
jgi:protein-S-isoprenylcysteine O-methyltransferase Ste14